MSTLHHCSQFLIDPIQQNQEKILTWLESHETTHELPLYSSVDIRDAGFKVSVVDTNLFPAGFNNLCEHGLEDSVTFMKNAILHRVPNCKNILIIAEEHTRNTWYLENVRILESIIKNAGFNTKIATFLTVQPEFCENTKFVELETATGEPVRIHCFKKILKDIEENTESFDLIIMNNDLTTGIPDVLQNSKIPIYPSIKAGWHSRLKSHHFCHTNDLIRNFADLIDLDPWLFSTVHKAVTDVDINDEQDRIRLQDIASDMIKDIETKYKEHNLTEKPYLFMKADSGTYGMGVLPIEDPSDILKLNRKNRNKLHVGKSSQVNARFLLQEGVPTIYHNENEVSEVCIYQIEQNLIGGFYRTHSLKNSRENLNSKGMTFKKMCPHSKKYGDCGVHHDMNIFDVYRILARIACIAAHREILHLASDQKTHPCDKS